MTAPIVDRVKEHLRTISLRRHQLILICENFGQSHVQMVAEAFNFPYIHLSLQVSQQLKDIPFKERPRKVFQTVQHLLKQQRSSVICLDHIELLFHPSLKQNPVTLFEHLSRNYVLIVSWKGTVRDGVLTYAKPEHPEYVHTKAFDAVVIHAAEGGGNFREV